MEFEPLDEELEKELANITEKASATGWADGIDFTTPEYRELKRLGFFEETSEFFDMTARVKPTYSAMKYFERKEEWRKSKRGATTKGVIEKVVDKGTDFAAAVVKKALDL